MAKTPVSRHATLKVTTPAAPDTTEEIGDAEDRREAQDAARIEEREKDKRLDDPISVALALAPFARDQSISQMFGQSVIDEAGGDVRRPEFSWRFKRWYFGKKVVIDTFRTQREYDSAHVEDRRAYLKKHGFKYAALGPNHSVLPHRDKKLKALFPSQTEQLRG